MVLVCWSYRLCAVVGGVCSAEDLLVKNGSKCILIAFSVTVGTHVCTRGWNVKRNDLASEHIV